MTSHSRILRPIPFLGLLLAPLTLISAGASAQSLGVCNSFYSSNFTLAQGKLNPATPSLSKPAKGVVVKEPSFNTCLVRATDHTKELSKSFARNDYSRRQAFNANSTYFIVYASGGGWYLYDATTLKYIRPLSPQGSGYNFAGDAEPQWHPTDPNILYYLPTSGGTKLLKLDVRTNTASVAADFAGKLPSWGANARHIWTKSEGSPSANGRYWGFQVEDSSFNLLGYMVWDLQNNSLVGSMKNSSRPDHSSMSAAGRWYVTSSDSTGTWAWSPDFSKKKKLLDKSEHSDQALGPNGQDYYVSIDFQSNSGDVFFVDIDACPAVAASASTAPLCPRTVLFPTYINGSTSSFHFSAKGMSKPGWAVMGTYGSKASRDGTMPWFSNKVFAIELKASPRIYPIAYTRQTPGGYWAEPHASVSRDFTRVIFNSNWGTGTEDVDAYIVHIPQSALPGGTTTPPPPSSPTRVTGGALLPSIDTNSGASSARATLSSNPATASDATTSTDQGGVATTRTTTRGPYVFTSRGERLLRSGAGMVRQVIDSNKESSAIVVRAALLAIPGASWFFHRIDPNWAAEEQLSYRQ